MAQQNLPELKAEVERLAIAALKMQQNGVDIESAHVNADRVLCELLKALGYDELVEEFEKVPKWYA